MTIPPSAWQVEQVFATWQAARARLLHDDPSLEGDEAALTALLGPEEGDIDAILSRVLRAAVHAENMEDAAAEREKAIAGRKKRYGNRCESLRALAFSLMNVLNKPKVELPDLTASLSQGKDNVRITDVDAIPDIYVEVVTERKPDKATLLADLKAGRTIAGCELSNGLPGLTIRTR